MNDKTHELTCVILAAGEGRRAGGYKPLMHVGGIPALDRIVRSARTVCTRIRVVGGAYFDDLRAHVESASLDVQVVRNENWKDGGMFSSVQLGLRGLDGPTFIHPADIPGPGPEVYRAMAGALASDAAPAEVVLRPTWNGRPGHPILLTARATRKAIAAPPTTNLRDVLAPLTKRDLGVASPLILRDFDTQADRAELDKAIVQSI